MKVLSEEQVPLGSLHDCHVYGITWNRDKFRLSFYMQYINERIQPQPNSGDAFRFIVSDARLDFKNVHDPRVRVDWSSSAIDLEISGARVLSSEETKTGTVVRHYELEFSAPDASVDLWSTGYEMHILGAPVVSDTPFAPELATSFD